MKVIVLKQGVHIDLGNEGNPDIMNKCKEICGAVVLLKAEKQGEENIIVDTGNWGYEKEILAALKKQGLKPENIKWVINTHLHFDHHSNNYLFKKAKRLSLIGVWFPKKSAYWYKNKRDNFKEIPGIKILATPGHVSDHISVVVKSKGKTYVISGDAVQERYIKNSTGRVSKNYIKSAKKIVDIADAVIPGHGKIIQGDNLKELKKAVYKLEV